MHYPHTATVTRTIGGLECELEVSFRVISYGHSRSYDEPGEGPEIEIDTVCYADTGRDVTKLCEETRDLWGKPWYAWGIIRFHHDTVRPALSWGVNGYEQRGTYPAYCNAEQGLPSLMDSIYEEVCVDHMPDRDYDPYDY